MSYDTLRVVMSCLAAKLNIKARRLIDGLFVVLDFV